MRSQVMQYATLGGLLLGGLILGFQLSKGRVGEQTALPLAEESQAMISPSTMPADYFPENYANKGMVEPLL